MKVVLIPKVNVRRNFYNLTRVNPLASIILVCSEDDGLSSKDGAGNNVHTDRAAIFFSFQPYTFLRKIEGCIQTNVERSWKEPHACLSFIMIL